MKQEIWLIFFGGVGTAFVSTLLSFIFKKLDRNWDALIRIETNQNRVLKRLDEHDERLQTIEGKTDKLEAEVGIIRHKIHL